MRCETEHEIVGFQDVKVARTQGGRIIEERIERQEVARLNPRQLKSMKNKFLYSIWNDFRAEGQVWIAERIIFDPDMEDIRGVK